MANTTLESLNGIYKVVYGVRPKPRHKLEKLYLEGQDTTDYINYFSMPILPSGKLITGIVV